MKIWVFCICRNSADTMPFWLRHYSVFADKMIVWDDKSDDGTRALLQSNPKVELHDWPRNDGINEDAFLQFAYEQYPKATYQADWIIWVDTDEFVYCPHIVGVLTEALSNDVIVIAPTGFNMMNEGMPKDDGRQIWDICRTGVYAPIYSKPIVFRPHIEIRWSRGKHHITDPSGPEWFKQGKYLYEGQTDLKLLHYRYLGYEYTKRKNANNYDRLGADKGAGWSCAPTWKGEHSPEWSVEAMKVAKEVV